MERYSRIYRILNLKKEVYTYFTIDLYGLFAAGLGIALQLETEGKFLLYLVFSLHPFMSLLLSRQLTLDLNKEAKKLKLFSSYHKGHRVNALSSTKDRVLCRTER